MAPIQRQRSVNAGRGLCIKQ